MDYAEMLKQEFLDRKQRRPAYSERAFARDLKISAGYINLLFRGLRSLSPAKGMQIASKLGWSEEKSNSFVAAIQKKNLESATGKKKRPPSEARFSELRHDTFRFIADLNHIAALTLIQSREIGSSEDVAKHLGVSSVEAELIVWRLVRLGLVVQEKSKMRSRKFSLEIREVPSEAIQSFHRQALQKAEAAIESQSVHERNMAALTISLDMERMKEAKDYINRFLKNFEKKFGHTKSGEIYQINTQLFALSGRKK